MRGVRASSWWWRPCPKYLRNEDRNCPDGSEDLPYDEPDDHRQRPHEDVPLEGQRPSRPSVPSTSTWPGGRARRLPRPNGAGKSTTLRMLTTLLPPTSGDAVVAGCDIRHDPAGVRRRIGYVGQGNVGRAHPAGARRAARPGRVLRPRSPRDAGAGRRAHRVARARPGRRPAGAVALGRPEAPARHRARAHPPPRAAVPRRAVDRTRPAQPRQPVGAHRRPAPGHRHDDLPHDALPRRGRPARRARHGDGPRRGHRRRHRVRAEGVARRRPGDPVVHDGDGCRGRRRAHRRLVRRHARHGDHPRRRPGHPPLDPRARRRGPRRRGGHPPAAHARRRVPRAHGPEPARGGRDARRATRPRPPRPNPRRRTP